MIPTGFVFKLRFRLIMTRLPLRQVTYKKNGKRMAEDILPIKWIRQFSISMRFCLPIIR